MLDYLISLYKSQLSSFSTVAAFLLLALYFCFTCYIFDSYSFISFFIFSAFNVLF